MSDPTILYPVSNTSREEFLAERKKQKYFITGMRFFILIFILAGWEIAARYHLIDAFIFSSPTRIFKVMLQMAADKSLFYHIGITIGETLVSFVLVLIIGALYGSISGYCGGMVDNVMQRIVEIIYSIPEMLIILLLSATLKPALEQFQNSGNGVFQKLVTLLGPNLISMFIAFGLLYWVTMSRIIRGQILQLKQQEYVTAARALGAKGGRIISKHLLPNCIGQIVTTTFLQIPSAIFLESFLSFLGVGVSAPLTSLGSMCSEALSGLKTYPYRLFIPAAILSVMILSLNLFGDGLRDALDPKLKK